LYFLWQIRIGYGLTIWQAIGYNADLSRGGTNLSSDLSGVSVDDVRDAVSLNLSSDWASFANVTRGSGGEMVVDVARERSMR
jgi:hypothetical protein